MAADSRAKRGAPVVGRLVCFYFCQLNSFERTPSSALGPLCITAYHGFVDTRRPGITAYHGFVDTRRPGIFLEQSNFVLEISSNRGTSSWSEPSTATVLFSQHNSPPSTSDSAMHASSPNAIHMRWRVRGCVQCFSLLTSEEGIEYEYYWSAFLFSITKAPTYQQDSGTNYHRHAPIRLSEV
jgi:hypothetical protein